MKIYFPFILLVSLCLSCKAENQSKAENTNSDGVSQLYFSKVAYNNTKNSEVTYVDNFNLHNDEFLNIHFTLKQPLIKSIKKLAPSLSENELLQKGNFQFSFLVDGKTIYVENLNTGAGTHLQKTKEQNQNIRLVTPEQIDFWGWFMWQRFLKLRGGYDAFTEGKHSLSIEVRTYINNGTLKVGALLAKGEITVDVPKIPVDESQIALQKIKPNSGWEISKDHFNHAKIEALNRSIAESQFKGIPINSVVVIKNNELLIEEYFNGASRESLHNPRSVGKTIASTMMGIAIEENHIESEEVLLKDYYDLKSFKNYSTKKDSVTLKSLLTMTSGFIGDDSDYNNPGNEEYMYPTDDWVKFGLDLPMQKDKIIGKDYTYFTAGVVLLGDIIHKSVPDGLVSYADKKLFSPLGITKYKWQYTPQNIGNTAGGIQLRAVDFAKYGQLYKNKGRWKGQQILPEDWVEKSLAQQVSQAYAGLEKGYYGYLFWNKKYTIGGKDYEVSFCSGNGGNKIFIFKDIPFVIVITASAYGMPNAHTTVDKMMTNYILPAILDKTNK